MRPAQLWCALTLPSRLGPHSLLIHSHRHYPRPPLPARHLAVRPDDLLAPALSPLCSLSHSSPRDGRRSHGRCKLECLSRPRRTRHQLFVAARAHCGSGHAMRRWCALDPAHRDDGPRARSLPSEVPHVTLLVDRDDRAQPIRAAGHRVREDVHLGGHRLRHDRICADHRQRQCDDALVRLGLSCSTPAPRRDPRLHDVPRLAERPSGQDDLLCGG